MESYQIIILLFALIALFAATLSFILHFLHRLNTTASRMEEGDQDLVFPRTSLPVLSKASAHYSLLSKALGDLQRMEKFQQKMMSFEKKEMAYLLERENLSRQLEKQLRETRTANEMVSNLNRDLEGTNESLNEAINRLSALNQISRMMGMEHDKKQIYRMAVSLPAELLQAEIGHLLLLDKQRGELVLEYSQGIPESMSGGRHSVPLGKGLAGWVAQNRKPLLVKDFGQQDAFSPVSRMGYQRRTAICVPIMIKEELMGVICLINRRSGDPFSEEERTLLATIASETAMAIHNALLLEKIQRSYFAMVQSLIVAVESKDVYTRGHSERVTQYSLLIGEQMGMSMEQLEIIQQAAVLHDIGKITVELSILNKPTSLEVEEYEKIKDHPMIGFRILEPIDFDERIKIAVLQHHERPDGKGYPHGTMGSEILFESRILSVADAFDAMTTRRPYREPMSIAEALREMDQNLGTQFDPDVVEIFRKVIGIMTGSGMTAMLQ